VTSGGGERARRGRRAEARQERRGGECSEWRRCEGGERRRGGAASGGEGSAELGFVEEKGLREEESGERERGRAGRPNR
jgi:hypothetical protein